ncbi:Islet cell autoantigen 1 [Merluccius polli]|uniref:Islet cell autoantigen 1 n=1 Tax=Merluccius polli TaxID=89951 RepID=A0AA47P1A4_MERPO|nr:Islet cell autoantigen 1 [Merluccius polli]
MGLGLCGGAGRRARESHICLEIAEKGDDEVSAILPPKDTGPMMVTMPDGAEQPKTELIYVRYEVGCSRLGDCTQQIKACGPKQEAKLALLAYMVLHCHPAAVTDAPTPHDVILGGNQQLLTRSLLTAETRRYRVARWRTGYAGDNVDRFMQSQDQSVVNQFQRRFWKTKQTLIKVTGKKEDEHVVASDADLDAKLEVFHSIQRTCMGLLKVIEQYQRRICFLSQEENQLGRFLRTQPDHRSRAGENHAGNGEGTLLLLPAEPLCRLYQEVETFRYRAISDTWLTVNRMEQSRTEYRGALLWMQDVSRELDPDTHKQMDKFRKVQAQVRTTKTSFDKLKNDVCQKVDLLGASRCNLLSHVLTSYQTTLLHFWEKTSHTMAAIHESFKGCQHSDFSSLKCLQEPNQRKSSKRKEKARSKAKPSAKATDGHYLKMWTSVANQQIWSNPLKLRNDYDYPGSEDLLSVDQEEEGGEKDIMALLNDILGGSTLEEGEFSQEWREVFGEGEELGAGLGVESGQVSGRGGGAEETQQDGDYFLPSHLLDQSLESMQPTDWAKSIPQPVSPATEQSSGANKSPSRLTAKEVAGNSKDLSAWFNLFADLDPLSNPDALGQQGDHALHSA